VRAAYFDRVSLSSTGYHATPDIGYDFKTNTGNPFNYFTYGVACSLVEIDCLTGDHQVSSHRAIISRPAPATISSVLTRLSAILHQRPSGQSYADDHQPLRTGDHQVSLAKCLSAVPHWRSSYQSHKAIISCPALATIRSFSQGDYQPSYTSNHQAL
jgi:hypothetical protein